MSDLREQIADIILTNTVGSAFVEHYRDQPPDNPLIQNAVSMAETIVALLPAPRVVTTVAELEALPDGSRIQMTGTKAPFVKQDGEWWSTHVPGKPVYDYLQGGFFPATVLTPAPEREPVTAEQAWTEGWDARADFDQRRYEADAAGQYVHIEPVKNPYRANVQPGGETDG